MEKSKMKDKSKIIFLQEEKEYDLNDKLLLDLTKRKIYQGKVTFVGVYFSEATNTSVICYPKYMKNIDKKEVIKDKQLTLEAKEYIEHMNLICKVIEKCKLKSNINVGYDFSIFQNQNNAQEIHRYSIAKFILQDYMENGLYELKSSVFSKNAKGPINWNRTINKIGPFISESGVYYFDTINKKQIVDRDQLITKVHEYVVNESTKLGKHLFGCSQIDTLSISKVNFNKEDRKKIISIIHSYRGQVFSDREISLLKALAAWFEQSKNYTPKMGTGSFNFIWEYVCKTVFGHNSNIEKSMPSPYLFMYDTNNFLPEEGKASRLIPDVLRIDKEKKILYILDAKYYKPVIENSTYSNAPKAADVSKQFSYETQLMGLKKENMSSRFEDYKSYNAFLIPHFYKDLPSGIYEKLGFVSMLDKCNILDYHIENNKIYYFQLNAKCFFEKFLSFNPEFTDEEMIKFSL